MGEVETNPNLIYIAPDVLKEIFLRLPLKSLGRFKSVSKEWRSILESKWFVEMHLSFQKSGKRHWKILATYDGDYGRPSCLHLNSRTDEGEEMVLLHCDAATRPSMTCDGLVCLPEPDWINVLNPSIGQRLRFPSGTNPVAPPLNRPRGAWSTFFPGYCAMGFGRDEVQGSYKVVRMYFHPRRFEIVDVDIGEWRKLSPPPYEVEAGRRSACVNGFIYWFEIGYVVGYKLLALDLHTEEFHDVPLHMGMYFKMDTQIANLEDHLALATTKLRGDGKRELVIWIMDVEERWSKTYSISLACLGIGPLSTVWFRPVIVSKQGNLVFHDDKKRLYKYYKRTNTIRQIFRYTWVISPYIESLVRFQNEHVEPRAEIACICGMSCIFKDVVALARVAFHSRVGGLLWRSKMKMLTMYLLVHLECYWFCNGDTEPCAAKLIFINWLACFVVWGHIFKVMGIVLLLKIVMSSTFTSVLLLVTLAASLRLIARFDRLLSSTEAI